MIKGLILLLTISILVPGAFGQVIRRGDAPKQIALTFDDGPNHELTPKVLDLLKQENIKGTFFVLGRKIRKDPEIVRRIAREGHEIGNHTFDHARLSLLDGDKLTKEIEDTSVLIRAVTGRNEYLFRPPYGKIRNEQVSRLEKMGYAVVLWAYSANDSYDEVTGYRGVDDMIATVVAKAKKGGIVLMHDDSPQLVQALPGIIAGLKRKGFEFVTVSGLSGIDLSVESELALRREPLPMAQEIGLPEHRIGVRAYVLKKAKQRGIDVSAVHVQWAENAAGAMVRNWNSAQKALGKTRFVMGALARPVKAGVKDLINRI